MTNVKQYFEVKEILERAKECITHLDSDELIYVGDLVGEVANDCYVIYYHDGVEALEQYGTFKALGEVKEYEEDYLGELFTDLSDPVAVANMVWYMKTDYVLHHLSEDRYEVWELLEVLDDESYFC